jgi:hypothetical protein
MQPDFRGARGSNTGDDFHELWALRQAFSLLDHDTKLKVISVEGLLAVDESGNPADTWDGVDCALYYYEHEQANNPERIVINQLKYSSSSPDTKWTIARLIYSSSSKKNNSVIKRMADAFVGLGEKYPNLLHNGNIVVKLVSNQEIDCEVEDLLSKPKAKGNDKLAALKKATSLRGEEFSLFAKALDFSECGSPSRFAMEELAINTISRWTNTDARGILSDLLRFIGKKMMPESKGEFIDRQSLIAQFGFADPLALFPCPSAIMRLEHFIPRQACQDVLQQIKDGNQYICLHGEGGCGKTTVLQELEAFLPSGSVMLVFDCYGGGRYLDSDACRHSPKVAFLHLSNDLARKVRIPWLLTQSSEVDYPKAFKRRIEEAAEIVAAMSKEAFVVVVIDAADNSVIAARTQSPPERSFIQDFVTLGDLPDNVRLIITARTGRLDCVCLPDTFSKLPIGGFSLTETTEHVRIRWSEAPNPWIDDFHHFSQKNPRVQRYALDHAGDKISSALDFLRPNGKNLGQLFSELLEFARKKTGQAQDVKMFCSGLIALPRPVPINDLAAVTGISEQHVRDLCMDLAPGVRVTQDLVSFADEDFEDFMRSEAESQLNEIRGNIADHFARNCKTNSYAAIHIAEALFISGRRPEILNLIEAETDLSVIEDPILRREIQLKRLQIAMRVCRESGDNVNAIEIILKGAEALKTGSAIETICIENPDLAAQFARPTASRSILRDAKKIEHHGRLLFQMMLVDACSGDNISVREEYRHVRAWMDRRRDYFEEQKENHPHYFPHGWAIEYLDIAAEIEAVLRTAGPDRAVQQLKRWSPKSIVFRVLYTISFKLVTNGDIPLLDFFITSLGSSGLWELFMLVPLGLAGKTIEVSRCELVLGRFVRHRLISMKNIHDGWSDDSNQLLFIEGILTACEILVAHGSRHEHVVSALNIIADQELRRQDHLFSSQPAVIDLMLRAHTLLERIENRKMTIETFLKEPSEFAQDLEPQEADRLRKRNKENREELQNFISPIINIYDIRAQALLGIISPEKVKGELSNAIHAYQREEYRLYRQPYASNMRVKSALAITRLMVLPGLDRAILSGCVNELLGSHADPFNEQETQIFLNLALDRSMHEMILNKISERAKAVKNAQTSAKNKSSALVNLSRALLPISFRDAGALFNDAIDAANEVDYETMYEIALLNPLAERAVSSTNSERRTEVARDVAIIVSDAAIRLEGHDHFPWIEGVKALTIMDVCLALAAIARWEDDDIVNRDRTLPTVLSTALEYKSLTVEQVVALSVMVDEFGAELIGQIVDNEDIQRKGPLASAIASLLAQEELFRFGKGNRKSVCEKISVLDQTSKNYWVNQLDKTSTFLLEEEKTKHSQTATGRETGLQNEENSKKMAVFDRINLADYTFATPDEIVQFLETVNDETGKDGTYIPVTMIFDRIRRNVSLNDRVAYLESVSQIQSIHASIYDLAKEISICVTEWHATPSVGKWCHEILCSIVIKLLPGYCNYFYNQEPSLPIVLQKTGKSDAEIFEAILDGLQNQVELFDVPMIYKILGVAVKYCKSEEAAEVLMRYTRRLVQRIPCGDRDVWDMNDMPNESDCGIARLLYAFMGDVDVRIRWRSAHALRRLVSLGNVVVLNKIISLYGRSVETNYRSPRAPFYGLAARLWLMITIARIAEESSNVMGVHADWLFEVACDESFPHVLIREFAKSAMKKLLDANLVNFDVVQQEMLRQANNGLLPRVKAKSSHYADFEGGQKSERKQRQFHFDSTDTLPYWYSPAMRVFAEVKKEEFLDIAERWIFSQCSNPDDIWQWQKEPRKGRYSGRSYLLWSHRQGEQPIMERFSTYLEWHAMWLTVGELMQTKALADATDDDVYDRFENWVTRHGLSESPCWLADLRSPKPIERKLWFAPAQEIETWIEEVEDNDFIDELGLEQGSTVIVNSHSSTQAHNFRLETRVCSALVSPETASALVRALQIVDDSYDYSIPLAGYNSEIDEPPYKLVGWLETKNFAEGIDASDQLRAGIRGIEYHPSDIFNRIFRPRLKIHDGMKWFDEISGNLLLTCISWSDFTSDDDERRHRFDTSVESEGWRMQIEKDALQLFLNEIEMDLIMEIEIIRRNQGYGYERYGQEGKEKTNRFDRIIVLRRDGTIEAAEGCFGAWKVS